MSFSLKLDTLFVEAQNAIETAVSQHGTSHEFSDQAVNISSLGIQTIEGDYILYASQCFLFDKNNDRFGHDDITIDSLCKIADYLNSL